MADYMDMLADLSVQLASSVRPPAYVAGPPPGRVNAPGFLELLGGGPRTGSRLGVLDALQTRRSGPSFGLGLLEALFQPTGQPQDPRQPTPQRSSPQTPAQVSATTASTSYAPVSLPADREQYRAYARGAAQRGGFDPDVFERLINQESGFNPKSYNAASGATGIAQIVPKWHPGVDPNNPEASLDYAAAWLGRLYQMYGGDLVKALIHYNGGGGAVAAYEKGTPYAESVAYVKAILGVDPQTYRWQQEIRD